MSRGLGSTYGGAATGETIVTRYNKAPSTSISAGIWAYINGSGQSGFGTLIGNTDSAVTQNLILTMNTSATSVVLTTCFIGGGANQGHYSITVKTGVWQHIGFTINLSSTANVPAMYLNGIPQTVTVGTVPTLTFNSIAGNLTVGNANGTALQFDGMLAHAAWWDNVILPAAQMLTLGTGGNPILIRPDSLVAYLPLYGINSPESDLINGNTSSITGTRLGTSNPAVQDLARIRSLRRDSDPPNPTVTITATLAAFQQMNFAAITATEAITASLLAYQKSNFASLAVSELINATLAALQNSDYAQISAAELFATTITAYQQTNYAVLSAAELIAASLIAAQRSNFASLSTDEIVAIAIHAYQQNDNATLFADEVINTTIQALQKSDFAFISEQEIIQAVLAAFQAMDYGTILPPVIVGRARLSIIPTYNVAISAVAPTVTLTEQPL